MRWWDLDEVLDIERLVFSGQASWSAEQLWSELAGVPSTRHYLVADTDSGLVGYAGLALAGDTGDVMTVAVAPDRRRRGVGRMLVEGLLAHAAQQRLREVLLDVRADNEPAVALYESLGFEAVSRRRDYYAAGVDGVVMRRRGQWAAS